MPFLIRANKLEHTQLEYHHFDVSSRDVYCSKFSWTKSFRSWLSFAWLFIWSSWKYQSQLLPTWPNNLHASCIEFGAHVFFCSFSTLLSFIRESVFLFKSRLNCERSNLAQPTYCRPAQWTWENKQIVKISIV